MLRTFRKLGTIVTTGLLFLTLAGGAQAQCGGGGLDVGGPEVGGPMVGVPGVFVPPGDEPEDDVLVGGRLEKGSFTQRASKKKKGRKVTIEEVVKSWGKWVPIAVYRGDTRPGPTSKAAMQAALLTQEIAEYIRGIPGTGGNDAASSIADLQSGDGRNVYIFWGFLWKTGPNKGKVTDIHALAVPQHQQTPWESKGGLKDATRNKIEKRQVIKHQGASLKGKVPRGGVPEPPKG